MVRDWKKVKNNDLRFIVVGCFRSGTTVLGNSLGTHPDIFFGTEIFNSVLPVNPQFPRKFHLEDSIYNLPTGTVPAYYDVTNYIESRFDEFNGFKILYNHVSYDSPAWRNLDKTNTKILHVVRKNWLDVYLSSLLALSTLEWHLLPRHPTIKDSPIYIDPVKFDGFCSWMEVAVQLHDRMLPSLETRRVDYDNLINDWDAQIASIQRFLGVSVLPIKPVFKKRTTGSQKELIKNYDELKLTFIATKWESFFKE